MRPYRKTAARLKAKRDGGKVVMVAGDDCANRCQVLLIRLPTDPLQAPEPINKHHQIQLFVYPLDYSNY